MRGPEPRAASRPARRDEPRAASGSRSVSNGQAAQNGTTTSQSSFSIDDPLAARFLGRRSRAGVGGRTRRGDAAAPVLAGGLPRECRSRPRSGHADAGCDAPIISPRFSKTWTHRYSRAELRGLVGPDVDDAADVRRIHRPSVRSWRGEKQTTRQDPALALGAQQPVVELRRCDVSGRSAAKSFVKTNVSAYRGLTSPLARVLPGHR